MDDCIFYSKNKRQIDDLILDLNVEFLLEKKPEMSRFLGLKIDRSMEGKVVLSQTGLIQRILSVMNMTDCNLKYTPVNKVPVGKDLEGNPCLEDWEYRLLVGMMLYLAGSTRPDISFAVHQCAHFSHNLSRIHEIALKHIEKYLQGSKDKGLILSPDRNKLQLDLYADTDFADLFVSEDN